MVTLLCASLIPASADRNDRGIVSLKNDRTPFINQGSWIMGGSLSGSTYGISDYGLSVFQGIGGDGYNISVKPGIMYTIKDDVAIGVTGIYDRTLMEIESAGVNIGDISLNIKDYYSLGHHFGGAFVYRRYLPLGQTGRFTIFVDGALQVTFGQNKISNYEGSEIIGTYQSTSKIALCMNPGLEMYVTPHIVLSAGVGIVGIGYSWAKQVHNQIATGTRNGFNSSYMLNLFNLSLGVYYCF